MPIGLIFAIFDLDEYRDCSLTHDDIELASLDLIVTIDDLVSLGLEVSYSDILSYISDGAMGWHTSQMMLLSASGTLSSVLRDHLDRVHSRSSP